MSLRYWSSCFEFWAIVGPRVLVNRISHISTGAVHIVVVAHWAGLTKLCPWLWIYSYSFNGVDDAS